MGLNDIPLFAMLQGRMTHADARQRVIAENVANADTPGFTPSDLKPFSFEAALRGTGRLAAVAPERTSAMHLEGRPVAATSTFAAQASPDGETKLDGNSVVLEDQMMKLTQARTDYDAAVSLYQKSLGLLRTAVRKPGG